MLVVVMLVAMTRLGCQWNRQPIAALPLPVAELISAPNGALGL